MFVIAKQVAFRYPLCPEHWREAAEEREAVEAGAARYEVEKAGEFYCESCGFKRVTKTSATREYDEYDHVDRFSCPECGTPLVSLLEGVDTSKSFEREVDKRTRYSDKPYPG